MRLLVSLAVCVLFVGLVSSLDKAEHCKCRIKTGKKIVGGKVAFYNDYPWHISLAVGEQPPKELRNLVPGTEKIEAHGKCSYSLAQSMI